MSDEGLPLNMGCVRSDDFYKGTTVKEEDGSSKAQKIEGASGKNELRTVETWSILRNPTVFLASNLNAILLLFAAMRLNGRSFERASNNGGTNCRWNLMLKVSL